MSNSQTDPAVDRRLEFAKTLSISAGEKASRFFADIADLVIEQKGTQDLVSNADRGVEEFIRDAIGKTYPHDSIVGEEYDKVIGDSGYTWVIDPIDGTANFVRGIPAWCVVLACVFEDETKLGVIYDPNSEELFWTSDQSEAHLNEKPMKVAQSRGLDDGSVGVGMNGRTPVKPVVDLIGRLASRGGIFYRNASGALMLAYVASGRLLGYTEPHMNAWDCLAGQLLIKQAGGSIETQSADQMLVTGGRVVAGTPVIYDELLEMSVSAFGKA